MKIKVGDFIVSNDEPGVKTMPSCKESIGFIIRESESRFTIRWYFLADNKQKIYRNSSNWIQGAYKVLV